VSSPAFSRPITSRRKKSTDRGEEKKKKKKKASIKSGESEFPQHHQREGLSLDIRFFSSYTLDLRAKKKRGRFAVEDTAIKAAGGTFLPVFGPAKLSRSRKKAGRVSPLLSSRRNSHPAKQVSLFSSSPPQATIARKTRRRPSPKVLYWARVSSSSSSPLLMIGFSRAPSGPRPRPRPGGCAPFSRWVASSPLAPRKIL